MHGPATKLTERLVERLESEPLDLLLCEGTNMNVGRTGSEKQLEADAFELISRGFDRGNKLVIVEVRSTDIDRMNAFHRVARKLDCNFLVTRRVAYLLHRIRKSGLAKRLWFGLPNLTKNAKVVVSSSKGLSLGRKKSLPLLVSRRLKRTRSEDLARGQWCLIPVASIFSNLHPHPGASTSRVSLSM